MQTCGVNSGISAYHRPSPTGRTRYTLQTDARKELLKRLLLLNHKLYAEEEAKGLHKKKAAKRAQEDSREQPSLL